MPKQEAVAVAGPFAPGMPQRRWHVPPGSSPRRPRCRRLLLVVWAGLAGCLLTLAYSPSLADSLESLVFVQPSSPLPPRANRAPDLEWDAPIVCQPSTVPTEKAALDDDTPVIGVLAKGHARAYLLEAFERGPSSHIVNDVLGGVPVSVTHCDISGCTRVFTGATPGRPLALSVAGRRDARLVLKFDRHLYRQETVEPLDQGAAPFPYRPYPMDLTAWGVWRQAHPKTDVYMGSVDEPTPAEAGGPSRLTPSNPSVGAHQPG